jgi:hypothetical protein
MSNSTLKILYSEGDSDVLASQALIRKPDTT